MCSYSIHIEFFFFFTKTKAQKLTLFYQHMVR